MRVSLARSSEKKWPLVDAESLGSDFLQMLGNSNLCLNRWLSFAANQIRGHTLRSVKDLLDCARFESGGRHLSKIQNVFWRCPVSSARLFQWDVLKHVWSSQGLPLRCLLSDLIRWGVGQTPSLIVRRDGTMMLVVETETKWSSRRQRHSFRK